MQRSDSTFAVLQPKFSVLISIIVVSSVVFLEVFTDDDVVQLKSEQARLKALSSKLSSREITVIEKEKRLSSGIGDTSFRTHLLKNQIEELPAHIYAQLLFKDGKDTRIYDAIINSIVVEAKHQPDKIRKALTEQLAKADPEFQRVPIAIAMRHPYEMSESDSDKREWASRLSSLIGIQGPIAYLNEEHEFWRAFHAPFNEADAHKVFDSLADFLNNYGTNNYPSGIMIYSFRRLADFDTAPDPRYHATKYDRILNLACDIAFDEKAPVGRRWRVLQGLRGLSPGEFTAAGTRLLLTSDLKDSLKKRIQKSLVQLLESGKFPRIQSLPEQINSSHLEAWLALWDAREQSESRCKNETLIQD
jgi:hypothetical protein